MIGVKKLDVPEETLLEMVNDYLSRFMPALGVATGISIREASLFRIELAERQTALPMFPPVPTRDLESTLKVVRQEGVK